MLACFGYLHYLCSAIKKQRYNKYGNNKQTAASISGNSGEGKL